MSISNIEFPDVADGRHPLNPRTMVLMVFVLAAILLLGMRNRSAQLDAYFFFHQDIPILCAMIAAMAVFNRLAFGVKWQSPIALSGRQVMLLAAAIGIFALVGTYLVMMNHYMSRDESLAAFAAGEIARGRLATPVPPEWRSFGPAMAPIFVYWYVDGGALSSVYLPMNSALRALVGIVADPAVTNPLLLVAGLWALWDIARRLWPDRPDAAAVAVLLAASSSQLIVNAMTAYAMTGHFALNMIWLALVLRGGKAGHLGAVAIAFFAVGLHKLHFHPAFAGPFILWLAAQGRWRPVALYCLAYAVIGWFWLIGYFELVSIQAGGEVAALDEVGKPFLALIFALFGRFLETLPLHWIYGVARFVAWQNAMLLPLVWVSLRLVPRGDRFAGVGIVRPLVLACALGLVFVANQGHGWGYRYVHGLIGCFCLLAGYGWIELVRPGAPSRAWAAVKYSTAVTFLVLLPGQLTMAHAFVAPQARLYRLIRAAPADVVLVDTRKGFYSQDVVQNFGDFNAAPKIMDLALVSLDGLETLCRTKRLMLVDRRHYDAVGMIHAEAQPWTDQDLVPQRRLLDRLGCAPPLPLG